MRKHQNMNLEYIKNKKRTKKRNLGTFLKFLFNNLYAFVNKVAASTKYKKSATLLKYLFFLNFYSI